MSQGKDLKQLYITLFLLLQKNHSEKQVEITNLSDFLYSLSTARTIDIK